MNKRFTLRAAAAVPIGALIAASGGALGAAVAGADPLTTQGGVTDAPAAQQGVTPAPSLAPRQTWVDVPSQQRYQNVQWRPAPSPPAPDPAPAPAPTPAPAPAPVAPPAAAEGDSLVAAPAVEDAGFIAPIEAPAGRLRIGDFITDKPGWMSEEDLEKTNNQSALIEADVANAWVDLGLGDVARADKVAGATVAAAGAGAVLLGIPAAIAGGAAGGAIGTPIGAAGGNVIIPGVGTFPGAVAGGTVGSAVGAAAVGVPAAILGGAAGGALGAAFGAGDTLPDELAIELFPEPQPLAITDAENTSAPAESAPQPVAGQAAASEGETVLEFTDVLDAPEVVEPAATAAPANPFATAVDDVEALLAGLLP